jgi:type 1 glutamine amidotransferase
MSQFRFFGTVSRIAIILFLPVLSLAQVTEQQARNIRAAVPQKARITPQKHRRVLIWNTPFMDKSPHKGYSIPQAEYAMTLIGKKTSAFEPVVSDDVAMYLPENLKKFDAIIFNNSNGPWIRPTEADMDRLKSYGPDQDSVEMLLRKSLLEFVRNGGGIIAYHHAIGGNTHWPEFQQLIGAGYWGHPWNEEVGVKLDEPDHPLLASFGGKDFRLTEEIFQFREPYSRKKLRVLLSLDTRTTNMTVPWIHRKDNDFALAWIHSYGKGRIFYSAIGHRTDIWWNKKILQFYLDGIQFAVGDLHADTTPSVQAATRTEPGFKSIFNGKDLTGWKGNPRIWSVKNGCITGQTTPENRISENNFLIWTGGDVSDFELRCKFRIEGGNSGIYFWGQERADMHPESLVGPQADFSADGRWTGVLMEYTRRGILAERGQKTVIDREGKIKVVGSVGNPDKLLKCVNPVQWNDYKVIAAKGHVTLIINDVVMCEVEDNDPGRIATGKLALQVHRGPDMLVQFKDIRIQELTNPVK